MNRNAMFARLSPSVAVTLAATIFPAAALAQTCGPASGKTWTVESNFKGDKARTQLSGAACNIAAQVPQCLVVNDEKTYAQRFTISGTTLVPGQSIDLIEGDDEPDAEGAAFWKGSFYVTGSHGNSRKKNKPNEASYVAVRIDATSGKVDRSDKFRKAIFASGKLGPFAAQPLKDGGPGQAGGANVEGIAVLGDRIYLGFRGPSVGKSAFLLSAPESEVFSNSNAPLTAKDHEVELGARTGIRDLAAVSTGLLILSGPVNEEDVKPAIFHWNPENGKIDRLAAVETPAGAKAETLLVLNDTANDSFRVLLIFEGPANGAPIECQIAKPK